MLPDTAAQWHATLNDFPSILFLLGLGFELAGEVTKRDSLKAAGFLTIATGAVGAILAVGSGLLAEETIEHGDSVHLVMTRHETLAISFTVLFVLLAAWRVGRRERMGRRERPAFLAIATVGALGLLWTAHVGGVIVYGYGGGIPTQVLEGALAERSASHTPAPGEGDATGADEATAPAESTSHVDPPGTPAHEHE
jgi:uncharacterized membrane protein